MAHSFESAAPGELFLGRELTRAFVPRLRKLDERRMRPDVPPRPAPQDRGSVRMNACSSSAQNAAHVRPVASGG